ncbi:hypothetical protein DACRYDRAFT_20791 [Dacryopinax primogenitus]|uniref:Uncharacterized protein n=1 Tax=Dacryopinax primogenitus (strain DJM 731) TaxID=1858805 RepID=M5G7P1_DACPD|nr:uncharacterized protein DACRYDRAFT_20791 [Dacryopinax primogenitus]EJU04170.1 hypothetical protein DACRYDRAFT_20791 [Dacryopinax primogenitus]
MVTSFFFPYAGSGSCEFPLPIETSLTSLIDGFLDTSALWLSNSTSSGRSEYGGGSFPSPFSLCDLLHPHIASAISTNPAMPPTTLPAITPPVLTVWVVTHERGGTGPGAEGSK